MRSIKRVAKRAARALGYDIVPRRDARRDGDRAKSDHDFPPDFTTDVTDTFRLVRDFTMTPPENVYSLIKAVEYVVKNDIPGEIVECGVWKGGSMMAVAHTLAKLGNVEKHLFLFDTFDGMSEPTELDRNWRGESAAELMANEEETRSQSQVWGVAPLAEVLNNMHSTPYPADRIHLIPGKVEETLPDQGPGRISILRLDTDWYESTKHELIHLFPRLSDGGVLIIDDYGHWEGARRAVDEYIEENQPRLLLCRINHSCRIAVKQA
jgi:O-methyltransferase